LIPLEEALRRVLSSLPPTGVESVEFREAQGRILAECYRATCDIPPFSKSAVDGYALRSADVIRVPVELACVGEIRAGAEPSDVRLRSLRVWVSSR
jgi:molybdopterin molybdotransferase